MNICVCVCARMCVCMCLSTLQSSLADYMYNAGFFLILKQLLDLSQVFFTNKVFIHNTGVHAHPVLPVVLYNKHVIA